LSAERQAELLRAIWAQQPHQGLAVPGLRALPGQRLEAGFAAYREHAKALSVRALGQAYPQLLAHLGETQFAGLAWAYARAHPPEHGDAAAWGGHMAAFLSGLDGMEALPPELAQLDWALHLAASLPDGPEPDAGMWAPLQAHPPEALTLQLDPGLVWLTLPALAAQGAPLEGEAPQPTQVAVWRQAWQPKWVLVPDDQALLWQRLAQGERLGPALEAVWALHPEHDLAASLALAWQHGWLLAAHAA
jgi:hypothetical protein